MKKGERASCEKPSLEVRGATQGRAWASGGKTDKEENGGFPRPADLTPRWSSAIPGCCWADRNLLLARVVFLPFPGERIIPRMTELHRNLQGQ